MSVFELKEIKVTPDIIQEYSDDLKNSNLPIVIDNGSYQCRVGWANQMEPSMIFKNIIAKPRKDRSKKEENSNVQPPTQIGNDIINIEALRFQLKTQFDRNVVTHYHTQEQIFDYIFTHLGITTQGCVQHPIVMTECFANPNYCRNLMSELLFECYDVPAVCYGIDSLFGFKHNQHENGIIISCGFQCTHVIPILNGEVCANKSRRINLGGYHMIYYMHRLLQLKYPVHVNAVTISRVERLLHEHCSIAYDYQEALRKWAKLEYYEENVKKIQLPYTQIVTIAPTAEQKTEKKRELARRLTEINARKREEKLVEDEEMIQKLNIIKELHEDGDTAEVKYQLKENSLANMEEVDKMLATIKSRIEKTKQKIAYMEANNTPTVIIEEKPVIPQPPTDLTIEEWVVQTRNKRNTLLERRHARRQRKQDLAKRRTAAAQERMRIISQLARKEKGTDDFGMRDEDWDIYKTISKEGGDSDSETENEKLVELEEILRHHDPTFEEPHLIQSGAAESYQLHVGVEAIRAPELLFQPSMIGSSEAGLVETIDYVLKQFTNEEQLILVNNVFLTGGCSKFPGLYERLSRELMEIRPFQSTYKITKSKDPSLDAWYGARDFANLPELPNYLITKQIYEEMGGEYLTQHYASNLYFPTPAPTIIPETQNEPPLLPS